MGICTIIIPFTYWSCTHDPIMGPTESIPTDTTTFPSDTILPPIVETSCDSNLIFFNRDILPIFRVSCAVVGCHDSKSGAEGYILTDYDHIIKKGLAKGSAAGSKIYQVITSNKSNTVMPPPPYAALNAAQTNMIKNWINGGLKNDTCAASRVCDTINIGYSKNIQPIFNSYCIGCHNAITNYSGIQLQNYNGVQAAFNAGRMRGAINWVNGFIKMPQDQPKLSDCDLKKIEIWVSKGSLNN